MTLNRHDKDLLIAIILLLFGLSFIYLSLQIDVKKYDFIESAASFPFLLSSIFTILSMAYLISSLKKGGKVTFLKTWQSLIYSLRDENNKKVLTAILIISLFIFIGVPYIGFYISGILLMISILIVYVPRVKPLLSIILSACYVGLIYLIFALLFKLQIR